MHNNMTGYPKIGLKQLQKTFKTKKHCFKRFFFFATLLDSKRRTAKYKA